MKIARRNPANGQVTFGPVVMTFSNGSDTLLEQIYGDGSLWVFDSATPQRALLLRVSPTTGQVENRIIVPEDPYRPLLAVDCDGFWMAIPIIAGYDSASTGAGSPTYHVSPGLNTPTIVHCGGYAVYWIEMTGHEVWVDESANRPGFHGLITQSLWEFMGRSARLLVRENVSNLSFVSATTASTGGLWASTMPAAGVTNCVSPERILLFNRVTGSQSIVATLPSEPESATYSCQLFGYRQPSTYADRVLLVLYQSLRYGGGGYAKLYRVTP